MSFKQKGDFDVCRNHLTRSLSLRRTITTTSASTLTLNNFSTSTQIFEGATAGQVINLGDTTTYPSLGLMYFFINDSTTDLTIEDDGGTTLFTLKPCFSVIAFLSDKSTADGEWRFMLFIDKTLGFITDPTGKLLDFEFSSSGNTFNKWLNVGHPSIPSDSVPFVAEWSGDIIGLSFSNANDDSDIDLEIYVNGSLSYTWAIRNKRTAYKVNATTPLASVSQGDRISIYAKRVGSGSDPASINGEVIIRVVTLPDGEGGTQNGV